MTDIRLFGYSDPLSARAGEPIDFMISADGTDTVNAEVTRLMHGDYHKEGPGFLEAAVKTDLPKSLDVKLHYTQTGSFVKVEDLDNLLSFKTSFTLHAFIWPSMFGNQRQTIMGKWSVTSSMGYALGIKPDGKLEFWVGDGVKVDKVSSEISLVDFCMAFIPLSSGFLSMLIIIHDSSSRIPITQLF